MTAATAGLFLSTPVLAHIDPDPTEAQAGSSLSVGFTVEHGCDGSPTTSLDMRLPDGITAVTPQAPDGWEGSISDNIVTFEGGPLPDDQQLTFNVALTLPPTPDTTIYFPFVQRCEVGEIRWIDVPSDGSGDELDEPAPAMALTGPVATTTAPETTTTVPATPTTDTAVETSTPPTPSTTAPSSTSAPDNTEPAATQSPQESVVVTTPSEVDSQDDSEVDPDLDAEDGDGSSDDSSTGVVALAGGGLVLAAGGAALLVRRRRS